MIVVATKYQRRKVAAVIASLAPNQPFFITGPTGVGKSTFAIELASQLNGEVIGADAFQLYRGLPLLTAQPTEEQQAAIPHHLIGVLELQQESDAVLYRTMALTAMNTVIDRKKIPLITGGTGFYVRSLIRPLDPLPPANLLLRETLAQLSHEELLLRLEQLDATAISLIDIKNRRRVERALEIVMQTNLPLAQVWKGEKETSAAAGVFLFREREDLYERIENNVRLMFDCGVVEEVARLKNIPISTTAAMTLGLRSIQSHLNGSLSLQETIQAIVQSTKRYAKRQLTWFKNQHNFTPINLSHYASLQEAVQAVMK